MNSCSPGERSEGIAQGLAHAEANSASSGDPDWLPRDRVTSRAGLAVLHVERAKSSDRHASVILEPLANIAQHGFDKAVGTQSGDPQIICNLGNELTLVHRRHNNEPALDERQLAARRGRNYFFFARRAVFLVAFFFARFLAMGFYS